MDIKKVLIVGVGLIGGSILKAIKKYNPYIITDIAVRNPEYFNSYAHLFNNCYHIKNEKNWGNYDLIIIGTPVDFIVDYVKYFSSIMSKECIITDVGSIKAKIDEQLYEIDNFIGSHPMAGKEFSGIEYAEADLLKDKRVVICKRNNHSHLLAEKLKKFWESIGSVVIEKNSKDHDLIVGFTSHLPHVISYLYTNVGSSLQTPIDGVFADSFEDFTRIGRSDPEMWTQIFRSNKKNIVNLTKKFIKFLNAFKKNLENEEWLKIKNMIIHSNISLDELKRL